MDLISEALVIPFRLRTVRVAIGATVLALAGLSVYGLLSRELIQRPGLFWLVLGVAGVGMLCMSMLPWDRMFRSKYGLWMMYAWSSMDIVLITLLIVAVGEHHGEMFFVYVLTTIFFAAAAYPLRAQMVMLTMTYGAYLGVLPLVPGAIDFGALVSRLVVLAAAAWMCSFLARFLLKQMTDHSQARTEADRRAQLLATVAESARAISSLEPGVVLERLVDASMEMGFDTANVCLFSEDGSTFQVKTGRGMPRSFIEAEHPSTSGMPALVVGAQGTVVVSDYPSIPNPLPAIVELGFKSVIASPIWVQGKIDGVLVGASKAAQELTPEEVEAFELLAGQAGRALENAMRFEDERRALEALAQLDQLKTDFMSNMSHELRTPLTTISGMASTLAARWDQISESVRQDFLARIAANVDGLHESVATLLDFSSIQSGGLQASVEAVPIRSMFESVKEKMDGRLREHDFSLYLEPGLVADADPKFLERVIENLLGNAILHTPKGTRVQLRAQALGTDEILIEVEDDGPGISPEEMRHVGEWFFRGGDLYTRETRGIGLGLALCSQLLFSQGSKLEIDVDREVGSRLFFKLKRTSPARLGIATQDDPLSVIQVTPEVIPTDNFVDRAIKTTAVVESSGTDFQ